MKDTWQQRNAIFC